MTENNKLIKIYTDILETAWMTVGKKGVISRLIDPETGEKAVVTIEDNTDNKKKKAAVLPLKENLVNLDSSEYLVIHPLSENPSKPASPVVDFLRRMMSVRINWILSTMLPELLVFASNPGKHDLLTPEQLNILTCLSDVGKDSAAKFLKLLEASKSKHGHFATIVSVYLTRGGVVNGKTFHRAAITKFTLYDEIMKAGSDNVVLGIKLSKKDREVFRKLFERVIPGIDDPQHYSTGSNANVAPFMDSMMNTFLKLFSITNDMIENYKVIFSIPELMTVPLKWSDDLMDIDNLSSIVRLVPPQRGNEGDNRVDENLRASHSADMGNFKSTAVKDASGNSFDKPQPVPQQPQSSQQTQNNTVSFQNTNPVPPQTFQQQTSFVPPWENQPATGFNNQSNNAKVSFSSLAIGQQSQTNFNGFQNQNQNRGSAFGNNFGGGFTGV